MPNVPLPHIDNILLLYICVQGFGISFRSVKFSVFFSLISALLRGLQKMAASKPISWLY